jgi:hypothetical protein
MIGALALAVAVDWASWCTESFDRARQEDRPVFVVVADSEAVAALSDDGASDVLGSRFTAVRVDREERPDVADLVRLALSVVSEAAPPPRDSPLWAMFTPSLHPLAAGSLAGVSGAALGQGLGLIADAYRSNRIEMEAKAGIAAASLAGAQVPERPDGPLTRATIEEAAKVAAEGPLRWGGLRLLRAEAQLAAGEGDARQTLPRVLERLASSPEPPTVAALALRLRALAEGSVLLGSPSLAAATRQSAAALLALPTREGALVEGPLPGDGRAFAYANGIAAGALAVASRATGDTTSLDAAIRIASSAVDALGPWPALSRCATREERCGAAYLEDYAFLGEALLDLHDATGDPRWRREAARAADAAIARFLDSVSGGFFDTDAAHEPLPVRLKDPYDGERPSANGVMVSVLLRLARATGERRYAELARRSVDAFRGDLQKAPRGLETLAAGAEALLAPPAETPALVSRPSRETRGPVTVEASVTPDRVAPGDLLEARVRITVSAPWTVNGHRPVAADLVPLTVSVPGGGFSVGVVRYPPDASSAGPVDVVVALRAGPRVGARAAARIAVRFQACRGSRCNDPESVVLEVPLSVETGGR